ncbi:hypothetical protein chiPu_0019899 [Chiloscyllium punctatum]|uniref:Secreted protein n=1 Tax=Chiloscyllium punctatum TaxID=137246 RepID=A0A401RTH0_CHIPU|nr:hypothetical protein [Chiloscyllium punctatum]
MQFYQLYLIGILLTTFGVLTEAQLPSAMTQYYCAHFHNSYHQSLGYNWQIKPRSHVAVQPLLCEAWNHDQKRALKESARQKSPYILKRQLHFINK